MSHRAPRGLADVIINRARQSAKACDDLIDLCMEGDEMHPKSRRVVLMSALEHEGKNMLVRKKPRHG
jgi:hypothetical protein